MTKRKTIKTRQIKRKIEEFPIPSAEKIDFLAKNLVRKIDKEVFSKKYAPAGEILKLVGAGVFIAASFAIPNLPQVLKPFLKDENEYEAWKRFNIPYLKRTLVRLERQKLVRIYENEKQQVVEITNTGRRRILKCALDELTVEKPKKWDGTWRLVCYDLPENFHFLRNIFRDSLLNWGFFPFQESLFLHAYPCLKEVEFLREYLGIGKFVRFFKVSDIENDREYRDFFGV